MKLYRGAERVRLAAELAGRAFREARDLRADWNIRIAIELRQCAPQELDPLRALVRVWAAVLKKNGRDWGGPQRTALERFWLAVWVFLRIAPASNVMRIHVNDTLREATCRANVRS